MANHKKIANELVKIAKSLLAEEALYAKKNAWLIDVLTGRENRNQQYRHQHRPLLGGSFAAKMIQSLQKGPLSSLPSNAISVLRTMYAEEFGRRDSKAYNEALIIFDKNSRQ